MRGNLVLNPNQVLFSSELVGRGAGLILKVLFNPTSRRDASHLFLISIWPKKWCTIVCMMWASLKNCVCMHYALQSSLGGGGDFPLYPKRCLFVGGNLVSNPNQVLSSSELAARGTGLILKVLLNPTLGRDVSHLYLISTWPKEWCTIVCVMWASLKNYACMHYALFRLGSTLWKQKGEGGGFPLNPKRHIFVGGMNLSPIRYYSLWEWVEEPMPLSRICSIPHRGETPLTLAL